MALNLTGPNNGQTQTQEQNSGATPNVDLALAKTSVLMNDPGQSVIPEKGKILKNYINPKEENEAFYQPVQKWSPEVKFKYINAMSPYYKNIDELIMTDIMVGRDMIQIEITDVPPIESLDNRLSKLNNKHYNDFVKMCYNFAIVNDHFLLFNHKLKPSDLKMLNWLTSQEVINVQPNTIKVPKIYPIAFYIKYYKMTVHKTKQYDHKTGLPIFFFPQQGVYTTRPDLHILRCELIRVNPHAAGQFLPLRKLQIGYYDLSKVPDFDMRFPPINNETPQLDLESRARFVAAMANTMPPLNLVNRLNWFYIRWKRTIDKIDKKENNNLKLKWRETIIELISLSEHLSRSSAVRSINTKLIMDKLYILKTTTLFMLNLKYISIIKWLSMDRDIEEYIKITQSLMKVVKKS